MFFIFFFPSSAIKYSKYSNKKISNLLILETVFKKFSKLYAFQEKDDNIEQAYNMAISKLNIWAKLSKLGKHEKAAEYAENAILVIQNALFQSNIEENRYLVRLFYKSSY